MTLHPPRLTWLCNSLSFVNSMAVLDFASSKNLISNDFMLVSTQLIKSYLVSDLVSNPC